MSEPRVNLFKSFLPEPEERASAPDRLQLSSDVLFPILQDASEARAELLQLDYLEERNFADWARTLGVRVSFHYPTGEPEVLWRCGWLRADHAQLRHRSWQRGHPTGAIAPQNLVKPLGQRHSYSDRWHYHDLSFHRFRLFPLIKLLGTMEWTLSRSSALYGKPVCVFAKRHVKRIRWHHKQESFRESINTWNGIVDLAVLLEPMYWPKVSGARVQRQMSRVNAADEGSLNSEKQYKEHVLRIFENIPKDQIAYAHLNLRIEAARIDDNHELYLLLRAASWHKRNGLVGDIAAALWIRHMAEVIRHAYDEVYEDRLVHEDEAFGEWFQGARKWAYGSEYPLENIPEMTRRILPKWSLSSTPRVRFYVEGETEFGALRAGLGPYLGHRIELINLQGKGWDDWLRKQLELDVQAKRISLIMLDGDRNDHLNSLKWLVRDGLIVGIVFVNSPDLELGCFSLDELLAATIYYESLQGEPVHDSLDRFAFESIANGKAFAERYCRLRNARGLKGENWGEALMKVAFDSNRGEDHPLVHAVGCAVRGITVDYEVQKTRSPVDPETLQNIDLNFDGFPE